MKRSHILALTVAFSGTVLSSIASADWPMARHDAQRTGAAAGKSDITSPVPYWRAYLGGTVSDRGAMGVDVDGDGQADIVFVGGGRLFAVKADNTAIWKTPLVNIATLDAAVDVDGDGTLDIVGHSTNQVLVVNSKTGNVEWSEPLGEMGTIGGVRVADFNRDGLPDVYVQECGACAVNSGNTGYAYSFASGFGSVQQLWTAPFVAGGGQRAMTVVDVDGDSHPELALADTATFSILDGATGATLATTPALPSGIERSDCLPANIDGQPGEELVCAFSLPSAPSGTGHQLFALHYSSTPSPSFSVDWQQAVGEVDGGLSHAPGMVADLDGDGSLEVTASGTTAAGEIDTYVFDAATGGTLATLPNQTVVGAAKLMSATKSVLLTQSGTTTSAWSFSRTASQPLTFLWALPDRAVLTSPDWALVRKSSVSDVVVATDLSSDGLDDLLTKTLGAGATSVEAYSGANGSATLLGSYALPAGSEPLQAWVVPPVNRPYSQVMLARSDGYLAVLDKQLAATAAPGVQLGGFYADGAFRDLDSEPIIADLGGSNGQAVLATDSRGALVRLDASSATFAVPPAEAWGSIKTTGPVVLAGLDGAKPGIACWKTQVPVTNPPQYQIAALRANGSPIWIVPIPEEPLGGVVPGKLDSDSVPDLFVQWGHPTDAVLHVRGISGAAGATLWNQAITAGNNRRPAGASSYDWNGDGRDDLVYQFYSLRVASGVDGQEIATHSDNIAYGLPTLYDVDGDGKPEVTLNGTSRIARTLDDDLTKVLWQGPINRPFPYGAIAACAGKPPRLVEGSYLDPSHLDITDASGATAGTAMHVILAGGKSYASDAAAQAAGAMQGQLTSASVHENLTGAGRPSAVVGSTDGWLYAVNPCDGTLDFSVDFGAPVGAVSFGDTDGDGLDEILVSVADGYLYDLKQPPLAAPSFVWDTDPDQGVTNADVDQIVTTDKLSGKWGAVTGATSYRVAVALADGSGYVSSPAWQDVGNVTETSVTGLPLTDGTRYIFAVEALKGTSASPDMVSNGVTVHFAAVDGGADAATEAGADAGPDAMAEGGPDAQGDAGPDAGSPGSSGVQGGGCGCRVGADGDGGSPLWLLASCLVGGAVLIRRRRSSRARG